MGGFVIHSKYPKTLGRIEAVWNKLGVEPGVDKFLDGELVLVERSLAPKTTLLVALDTVEIPAVAEFVAREKFTTQKTPGDVQLYWMNGAFKTHFVGKVEKNVAACALQKSRLTKNSLDRPILDELGDRAKTALAHFWEQLKKQPKGEMGILLTDGRANIQYIEDINGREWAVNAYWYAGFGWYVYAGFCVGSVRLGCRQRGLLALILGHYDFVPLNSWTL